MLRLYYLLIVFQSVYTETTSNNTQSLIHTYEKNLNTSLDLTRRDKSTVDSWNVEFDIKRVNITARYRIEMNRHKDHIFARSDANLKWDECIKLYKREIGKSEDNYYESERDCLNTTTAEEQEKRIAVEQVEKEIRKWRKGYRYLVRLCNLENPTDRNDADSCLVQYMERDSYNTVVERLLILKLEAMRDLSLQLNASLLELKECLELHISEYLEGVRIIMETLNRCYNL